ncbi:MAG: GNAT family N-acetyltransferase [Actinomycetota bacterium]
MAVVDRSFAELTTRDLHDILRLRVDVFVVEQECAYAELDGRDAEAGTRHVWMADDAGPTAYLRVLDDGEARRIGRVVTRGDARGAGLAGDLVDHALATTEGPWVLDAQTYLESWYAARGFASSGPEFVEDGIAHVPMRREV